MNYKILAADDEQMERMALEAVISRRFGSRAEIRLAANGKEAVSLAREFQPDIALLDIKMPGMNGIEAGKEILDLLPDCYIIMLTGFTYFSYARESVNIGAADFLVKPAADEEITGALEKAMVQVDQRRTRRRAEEANQKKAMQAEQYMESELVSAIAFSNADEAQTQELMEGLGLTFRYGAGVIVDARLSRSGESGQALRICRSWARDLGGRERICICEHYGQIYLLVLSAEIREREWYKALLGELNQALELAGFQVKIAAGIQVAQLKNIYLSFREAKRNLGSAKQIHVHRREAGTSGGDATQGSQEQRMAAALKAGEYDEAMLYLEQLMERFFDEAVEPVLKLYELLVAVNRTLKLETEVEPVYTIGRRMLEEPRREPVMAMASGYMETMIDRLIAREGNPDAAWAVRAEEYIQANYMNNITLEDMAAQIGFSIYYFSKLFKQKFQMNFVDYLTRVRILKAREMLEQGETSIKEVSSRVGYSEANYFARVFKKETGIPPSVYQKNAKLAKKC
ncbi:MAG: response regulator [Lachnospiraceae bacterium]|nr:response regulator [Lachnospiraceae bacterium]